MSKQVADSLTDGSRPVALITGANKGIGKEVARQLGSKGYEVLLGARDRTRGMQAVEDLKGAGLNVSLVELVIGDDASVRRAGLLVAERYGRLDVLVNNAGVLLEADFQGRDAGAAEYFTAPSAVTMDVLERTFATNFFGPVRVTNTFLPLLRRSTAGRIVNVSSRLSSMSQARSEPARHLLLLAYNASKAALNSATVQYAHELRGTNIKVNAVDPGHCATDINGNIGDRTPAEAAQIIVRFATLGPGGPSGEFHGEGGAIPW